MSDNLKQLIILCVGIILGLLLSNLFFEKKYELYVKQQVFDECFEWYAQDPEKGISKENIDLCKNKY